MNIFKIFTPKIGGSVFGNYLRSFFARLNSPFLHIPISHCLRNDIIFLPWDRVNPYMILFDLNLEVILYSPTNCKSIRLHYKTKVLVVKSSRF